MIKRPRQHNEKHLQFIRSLPCCVCGDPTSTEAAHIRCSDGHLGKRHVGKGEKPDDIWTVPLCSQCHRQQHEMGEMDFWWKHGWDIRFAMVTALALWAATGQHEVGEQIVRKQ